jgi:predicted transcriptional regulator
MGTTEARLMEIAWSQDEFTVKKAIFLLGPESNLAYTTVMTILNRLAEKGLLTRRREGRSFSYRAAVDRTGYLRDRAKAVLDCLRSNFPDIYNELVR